MGAFSVRSARRFRVSSHRWSRAVVCKHFVPAPTRKPRAQRRCPASESCKDAIASWRETAWALSQCERKTVPRATPPLRRRPIPGIRRSRLCGRPSSQTVAQPGHRRFDPSECHSPSSTDPTGVVSDGTFEVDSGIAVGVFNLANKQFVPFANGAINIAPQYQTLNSTPKTARSVKNSGVFTIPLTAGDGNAYKTNPLAIQVNGTTVAQENPRRPVGGCFRFFAPRSVRWRATRPGANHGPSVR